MKLLSTAGWRLAAIVMVFGTPIWGAGAPAGIKNFQQINDFVYRGAQPSAEGFGNLAKIGIKTVIDLREAGDRSSREANVVRVLGMRYVNIPLDGFAAPSLDQMSKILRLIDDRAAGPIFVHCRRGADRTGTVIAAYRINHDHWDNRRALNEARVFKMAGWELRMQNFVLHFQPFAPAIL